jgi:hypothetical protein
LSHRHWHGGLRIVEAQGSYWVFDEEGRIDEHLREVGGAAMSFAFMSDKRDGKIVSLTPSIRRREFRNEHRWEVDKDTMESIAADIWPAKGLRASDVASVKGKAPKRPPMTSEGKYALAEIERSLGDIAFKLVDLTSPALNTLGTLGLRRESVDSGPSSKPPVREKWAGQRALPGCQVFNKKQPSHSASWP